jgi:hypothetical protein
MSTRQDPQTARRAKLRRRRLLLGAVLALIAAGLAAVLVYRDEARTRRRTCEYQLRLMYVIWHHVPSELLSLPPDKAISYSFCDGCRQWTPTEQEREYLARHNVSQPEAYGWSLTGLIYCYNDPECDQKGAAVANMTPYTAAASIPASSYVWYPKGQPEVLAGCPYHHIAVLRDTGEIIAWAPTSE